MSFKPRTKVCYVAILVLLLLFAALGPAKWQYRTGLGWRLDHVVGYFGFTLMFWLVWQRPFLVGGALMGTALLLEALQALTPDRCCDFEAALYGVAGALAGALCADLFTRMLRRLNGRTTLQRFCTRWLWHDARLALVMLYRRLNKQENLASFCQSTTIDCNDLLQSTTQRTSALLGEH